MSLREVKALSETSTEFKFSKTHSGKAIGLAMSEESSLERQVEQLQADLAIANKELVKREKQLKDIDASMQQTVSTALEAENKANEYYKEIKYLQQQLEDERIQAELSMLRAVNELHLKHQHSLQMEKERFDRDYDKMENDFQKERESLLRKIASLEEEKRLSTTGTVDDGKVSENDDIPTEGYMFTEEESLRTGGTTLKEDEHNPESVTIDTVSQGVTVGTLDGVVMSETTPVITAAKLGNKTNIVSAPMSVGLEHVVPGVVGCSVKVVSGTAPSRATESSRLHSDGVISEVSSPRIGSSNSIASDDVSSTVSKLLQVQIDAMAAQARAAAVQNLPALRSYTGEGRDALDDNFESWIERFRERAAVAGWNCEQRLYYLKFHLDKTANEVFRMIPDEDKSDFDKAVKALQKRFKPADIEELHGLEFHHLIQGEDTIEQLGMNIQLLGRKAFPTIVGKDFDRLLKGRFFQALLVKWQKKLGAPKPDETFHQLYDRARMLEQFEKQYEFSAQTQSEYNKQKAHRITKPRNSTFSVNRTFNFDDQISKWQGNGTSSEERRCYKCKEVGHIRQNCPQKSEAPGRSTLTQGKYSEAQGKTRSQAKSTVKSVNAVEDLTEEELEKLLMERRLVREQQLLSSEEYSGARTVQVSKIHEQAVGSTPKLDVLIEGVPVTAMVDTGAESTIISRQVLHSIVCHKRQQGLPDPVLSKPSVRLFGKDGQKGGHELTVTAQLTLSFSVDGKTASVPTFVQPESEQECLLGMNLIPKLGIKLVRNNGEPVHQLSNDSVSDQVEVCLVKTAAIPCQHGKILTATISGQEFNTKDLEFIPCQDTFKALGISVRESLVTSQDDGKILIPVQNFQGITVHLNAGTKLGVVKEMDTEPCVIPVVKSKNTVLDDPMSSDVDSCTSRNAAVTSVSITPERVDEILACLDLPVNELLESEVSKLKALVMEFGDVFALNEKELGCTNLTKHYIDTGNHCPIRQQPYRTPVVRRKKVAEMVEDMKHQGVIQPSCSPWASPIVLVPKKDGKLRFCVDYRRLNAITTKDVFPLPRVDDILDALGGAKYFSSLDLLSGYWQVQLDEEAVKKSAFITFNGLYEFTRMPFGLCNAPATFQRLMQRVLGGLLGKTCFVFLDDVLIASKTFEEHLEYLRAVLSRFCSAGLRLKPQKCTLLRRTIKYLGYMISPEGIYPDPEKTVKVANFPTPSDVSQVRQFLGLASYYRRFITNFAKIAKPLHDLMKKDTAFDWSQECQEAFNTLKQLLCSAPVLAYPEFGPGKCFILETDASIRGLGAVLSQTQEDGSIHPIAYASRSLDKHERNYGISELETLGLVWAVRYFRNYLLGHPCIVYTDHVACLSILNTNRPSGKLARWALTIQEMDLTIQHKPGKKNQNADALSRNPVDATVGALAAIEGEEELPAETISLDMNTIQSLQQADQFLSPMLEYLKDGKLPLDDKKARRIVLTKRISKSDKLSHLHVGPTTRSMIHT